MKVKDLIDILKSVDQDCEVIMSSDSEGNNYSPLSSYWQGSYVPRSTCRGEVYYSSLDDDDNIDPEDVRTPGEDGAVSAIILSPIS